MRQSIALLCAHTSPVVIHSKPVYGFNRPCQRGKMLRQCKGSIVLTIKIHCLFMAHLLLITHSGLVPMIGSHPSSTLSLLVCMASTHCPHTVGFEPVVVIFNNNKRHINICIRCNKARADYSQDSFGGLYKYRAELLYIFTKVVDPA